MRTYIFSINLQQIPFSFYLFVSSRGSEIKCWFSFKDICPAEDRKRYLNWYYGNRKPEYKKNEWETNIFFSIAHIHTKIQKHPWNLKNSIAKGNPDLSPSNQGWKRSRLLCPYGYAYTIFFRFGSTTLFTLIPSFPSSICYLSCHSWGHWRKNLKGKKSFLR
jgi:hypothetical protein